MPADQCSDISLSLINTDMKDEDLINQWKSNTQKNTIDHKEIKSDEISKPKTENEIKVVEKPNIKNAYPNKDEMNVKPDTEPKIKSKKVKEMEGVEKSYIKKAPPKEVTNGQVESEPKKKLKTEKELKEVEKPNIKKASPNKDILNVKAETETEPKKEKEIKAVQKNNIEKVSPNTDVTDVKTKAEKAAEVLNKLLPSDTKTVAEKTKKQSEQKLNSDVKKLKSQTDRTQATSLNAIAYLMEMRKKEAPSNKENKTQAPSNKENKTQAPGKKKASPVTDDQLVKDLYQRKHMSSNLDLDLEVESSIVLENIKLDEDPHVVIGEKILKYKPPILKNNEKNEESVFERFELDTQTGFNDTRRTTTERSRSVLKTKPKPTTENHGILKFTLSDQKYIGKGWTMLPTEKILRKMYVYRMRPSHPEFDWFENNKNKGQMFYRSGEKLAEFRDDGCGCLFYKTGKLALDYYNAEESNVQKRYIVYSTGEPDERGRLRPRTILATFDYIGNGVVFDHTGQIRLKYNQTEGVVLDRSIGPVSHWKWHTLNDPPELQQVMIDTHAPHKDPRILAITPDQGDIKTVIKNQSDNEAMLAIEFNNFIKDKSNKVNQSFKPFQIRMKGFKINENFSLRILDQSSVYLIFRDGNNNVKLNIGMILDHREIVDTVTAEVGDCSVSIEKLPASTDSIAALQKTVARAQRQETARARRELRLRPAAAAPVASADRLRMSASRPLRPPLLTHSCTGECKCTFKESTLSN